MAIPQSRYVKITSGEGTPVISERNLQTLVITEGSALSGTTFDTTHDVDCYSLANVKAAFGDTSAEYAWAEKYFGYSDPNGSMATRVTFAKKNADGTESPKAAFIRISARTNNFGTFTFLKDMTADQISEVAESNNAANYQYLFVAAITRTKLNSSYSSESNPLSEYVTECGSSNKGLHLVYQDEIDLSSSTKVVPKTYILCAIFSSIDWSRTDATVSPMFRTLEGESADVFGESDVDAGSSGAHNYTQVGANSLDNVNVNYYGQVQINGSEMSFYQRGMNTNAETSLVYMGEVWIKSEISSRILELMLSLSKIKANEEGNAQIYTTIDSVCTQALENGAIEMAKELDTAERLKIYQQTRDSSAADIIVEHGYWLQTWIDKSSDGKGYVAKYLLLYSKQDTVVKVEGSDVLY